MDLQDNKTTFRLARLIQVALFGGVTVFLGVALFIAATRDRETVSSMDPWILIGLTLALWASSSVMSRTIITARKLQTELLGDKAAQAYLQMVVIKSALLEGPALLGVVGLIILLPGHDLSSPPPELGLLLVPYFGMLLSILFSRPGEEDFNERVRVARENQSMRR